MNRFVFLFSGWRPGWVGPSSTFTITVSGDTREEALASLTRRYRIETIKTWRQLKH